VLSTSSPSSQAAPPPLPCCCPARAFSVANLPHLPLCSEDETVKKQRKEIRKLLGNKRRRNVQEEKEKKE
jgi:hypothetical protein